MWPHISMELQLSQSIQVWLEMWTILDSLESTSEVLLWLCHFVRFQKQNEEEKREGKSSMETITFSLCCLFRISPEIFCFVIFHSNFHVTVQAHMLLATFMSLHILVISPAVCMYICMFAYNYQFEDLTGKALPGRLSRVTPPILKMYLLKVFLLLCNNFTCIDVLLLWYFKNLHFLFLVFRIIKAIWVQLGKQKVHLSTKEKQQQKTPPKILLSKDNYLVYLTDSFICSFSNDLLSMDFCLSCKLRRYNSKQNG